MHWQAGVAVVTLAGAAAAVNAPAFPPAALSPSPSAVLRALPPGQHFTLSLTRLIRCLQPAACRTDLAGPAVADPGRPTRRGVVVSGAAPARRTAAARGSGNNAASARRVAAAPV